MILKKIFRFEIFWGICKIFLDCPFSASVFFLMVVTNVLLIIITLLPVCVKSNQPTVMQAIKRKRDVAEDSDEEGNVNLLLENEFTYSCEWKCDLCT